jgi:RHS repeat-associated protein
MGVDKPGGWFAYERPQYKVTFWQGSLLKDSRDASENLYRRARYYDPSNGRFTQEDPIGLAGGANLYGFASGDPVNFSDPFGLWPDLGGIKEWWGDVKRDVGRRVVRVLVGLIGYREGEKIEPIDPTPPPIVAPAPGPGPKPKRMTRKSRTPGRRPIRCSDSVTSGHNRCRRGSRSCRP